MTGKNMPAMPWFFTDYLADTIHLTTRQHGAYMLLLGHCWKQGGKLPNDEARLMRLSGLSEQDWAEDWPVISEFWTEHADCIRQKRLSKELRYVSEKVEKRRAAGKRGGHAKASKQRTKRSSKATVLPEQSQTFASDLPGQKGGKALAPTPTLTPNKDPSREQRYENDISDGAAEHVRLAARLKAIARIPDTDPPRDVGFVRQWLVDWGAETCIDAVTERVNRDRYQPPNNLAWFRPVIEEYAKQHSDKANRELEERLAQISDPQWRHYLALWAQGEPWPAAYRGPKPNDPATRVPEIILNEYSALHGDLEPGHALGTTETAAQ